MFGRATIIHSFIHSFICTVFICTAFAHILVFHISFALNDGLKFSVSIHLLYFHNTQRYCGNTASGLAICSIGSRPSDHYFCSVCWTVGRLSVCLFVQRFSQPSLIRFQSNLDISYMAGSSCVP